MKNSVSFNVDHTKLPRGIYLSKIDTLGDVKALTIDIRLREPYKEEVISNLELHTFEHCFATAIREISQEYTDVSVTYFGPMGCQTGFYLVLSVMGYEESSYFKLCSTIMKDALAYLKSMTDVPAKNQLQCGCFYTLGTIKDAFELTEDMETLVDTMIGKEAFYNYVYL